MTPKEKADDLVTKYRRFLPMNLTTMLDAKGCAIIACNEVIDMIDSEMQGFLDADLINYWEEVKKEIENYDPTFKKKSTWTTSKKGKAFMKS